MALLAWSSAMMKMILGCTGAILRERWNMFRSQKVYIRPVNKGRVNALEEAAIFSARILIKIGLRSWAVGRFKDKAEIERERRKIRRR